MWSLKCQDNTLQEISICPIWIKNKYPKASYLFKKNGLYYILSEERTNSSLYLVNNIIYCAILIGTEMQIDLLKLIQIKVNGYKKISIYEFI